MSVPFIKIKIVFNYDICVISKLIIIIMIGVKGPTTSVMVYICVEKRSSRRAVLCKRLSGPQI